MGRSGRTGGPDGRGTSGPDAWPVGRGGTSRRLRTVSEPVGTEQHDGTPEGEETMEQMLTVLLAIGIVATVTAVLIPMLSAAGTPERKAERDAGLEDQVAILR